MTSENAKRIAINTLMLYIRMLLVMGVTLYTSRIVLNILGAEDFGIYNVVGGIVILFSFLNTSMVVSIQRFFSYELGKKQGSQLQKIFSTAINLHIGIAFIILLLSETVGVFFLNTCLNIPENRLLAANWIFHFSILSFMVSVIRTPFNAIIMAYERMNVYAYISILEVLLNLLIAFFLSWVGFDKLKLYALLIFAVTFVVAIIYASYCLYSYSACRYSFFFDKRLFSKMLGFSSWNLFGAFSLVVINQGGNILLNIFFGPVVNASRGISYQVNAAINSFVFNLQSAINPQIVKLYASEDYAGMLNLVYRGSRLSYFLLFIISFPVLFYTDFILTLWLGEVPEYAAVFCRLVIISTLIDSLSGCMAVAVQATGNIRKYQIIISCLLLLNLPISYCGLQICAKPEFVFYTCIFISLLALFMRVVLLTKICGLLFWDFLSKVLFRIFVVSVVSISIFTPLFCMSESGLTSFLIFTGFSFTINITLIYWLGLESDEKKYIYHKIIFILKKCALYDY